METESLVLLFADGGVAVFRTVAETAGSMEAIDVENGEYEAFFTVAGERLVPVVLDATQVALEPSGVIDPDALPSLLHRERDRYGGDTA